MKIGIAGDWHGDAFAARYAIDTLIERGARAIFQVGDFGFGGDKAGALFLDNVDKLMARHNIDLYVTPGNHEDYDYLDSVFAAQEDADHFGIVRDHILVMPRGYRSTLGGRSFLFLGGAPSVDRMWRLDLQRRSGKKYWWTQEALTEEDVARVAKGGQADVMITHDAPFYPAVDAVIGSNPGGFPQLDLDYAQDGRRLMDRAVESVTPKLLFHGHYHFATDQVRAWSPSASGPSTRIIGLNLETAPGALALLETDDLSVEVI